MAALLVDFPPLNDLAFPLHRPADPWIPKKERRVSFHAEAEVNMISIHHNRKTDLWYSNYDMKCFKYDAALTVKTLKAKRMLVTMEEYAELLHQGDTAIFLGLERHLLDSTAQNIVSSRQRLMRAILLEQDRQDSYGICDPDILANISKVESGFSRKRARIIGLIHAGI